MHFSRDPKERLAQRVIVHPGRKQASTEQTYLWQTGFSNATCSGCICQIVTRLKTLRAWIPPGACAPGCLRGLLRDFQLRISVFKIIYSSVYHLIYLLYVSFSCLFSIYVSCALIGVAHFDQSVCSTQSLQPRVLAIHNFQIM